MAVSDAVKVKKSCDFHTLLVGMKHRILTLENKSVASCISKYTLTIQPNNPAPNYLSGIMKTMCTQWSVWKVIVVVIIITQNTNALQLVNGWAVETLNGRENMCMLSRFSLSDSATLRTPGSPSMGFSRRVLERVAMPSSRGSSPPEDRTLISCVSCLVGRYSTAESPGKTIQWSTT